MQRRPETRHRMDLPVFISWQDRQGTIRRAQGRCVDLSASGAHVKTLDPLPPQSAVVLHSEKFGRIGEATVRYCNRTGMKYAVGLHFSAPLGLGNKLRKEFLDRASSS